MLFNILANVLIMIFGTAWAAQAYKNNKYYWYGAHSVLVFVNAVMLIINMAGMVTRS